MKYYVCSHQYLAYILIIVKIDRLAYKTEYPDFCVVKCFGFCESKDNPRTNGGTVHGRIGQA